MTGNIKKILEVTSEFILNFSFQKYSGVFKIVALVVATLGLLAMLLSGLLFGF